MALFAGTGVSHLTQDPETAGRDAVQAALKNAGIGAADMAIVLSSIAFDQEKMAKGVAEALDGAPFVGCTGAGAITNSGVQEAAIAVLVLKSDEGKFVPVKVT